MTHNSTAIVTGSSSGIGLGIAKALLARGDNVVLNARNEARLRDVAEGLDAPDRVAVVAGNISDPSTPDRLVAAAVDRFGGVDLLVNNAGHFDAKPLADYTGQDLDGYLGFLKGSYFVTQAVAAQLKRQGRGGSIVNISTVLASRGVKAFPSSGPIAAKAGLDGLTTSLAIELAADRIRVNTVAPGSIRTPLWGMTDEQFDGLADMQPLGRVGEVADIVQAVLYFADATFTTGVVLPVDGGVHAGS